MMTINDPTILRSFFVSIDCLDSVYLRCGQLRAFSSLVHRLVWNALIMCVYRRRRKNGVRCPSCLGIDGIHFGTV